MLLINLKDIIMIVCFLHMQVKSFWKKIKNTYKPFNYNFKNRPMHQDIKESYVENGAFYIFKKKFLF